MNAIIVEDTPDALEFLRDLIGEECPEINLVGEAQNLDQAEVIIDELEPDLVFLDIEMWGGRTSFDLLKKLESKGKIRFQIIFVTAHSDFNYAIKAMEYSAIDYLTKPVERSKLKDAVEKVLERKKNTDVWMNQLDLLLESAGQNQAPKSIAIPLAKGAVEIVQPDEIAWLESGTEITHVYLQSSESLVAMRNIGHFHKILIPQFPFFPVSQSAIVYIPYVKRYNHGEHMVTLKNGQRIVASRRGGQDFRQYLLGMDRSVLDEQGLQLKQMFRRFFR